MRKAMSLLAIVVLAAVAWTPTRALARSQAKPAAKKQVLYFSSSQAKSMENTPGVSEATVWGDPSKGPHAGFTKMKPGYDAGMHTHTSDVTVVVIKGAYLYRDEAGDKRVGPGDLIRIPGGHKHWSGADKTEGALFYQESPGKFDIVPAK